MTLMTRRKTFRGDPALESTHIALCTWADEIRDRRATVRSVLGMLGFGVSARSPDISNQSGEIDRIVCTAHPNMQIGLRGYYAYQWPVEAIGRRMIPRVSGDEVKRRLTTYRQSVKDRMAACGWQI